MHIEEHGFDWQKAICCDCRAACCDALKAGHQIIQMIGRGNIHGMGKPPP